MNNERETISPKTREFILERDGYCCRYCGNRIGPFHLDHVYPFSKGGETTINNLVTACEKCNFYKHNSIGLWPKPVGYFEKQHALMRRFTWVYSSSVILSVFSLAASQIFSHSYLVIVALFFAGITVCTTLFERKILDEQ